MKCAFCGFEFSKEDAKTSCRGCPMAGACHKLHCPNCGYENAVGPDMEGVKKVWKWLFPPKHRQEIDTGSRK